MTVTSRSDETIRPTPARCSRGAYRPARQKTSTVTRARKGSHLASAPRPLPARATRLRRRQGTCAAPQEREGCRERESAPGVEQVVVVEVGVDVPGQGSKHRTGESSERVRRRECPGRRGSAADGAV